jgi:hypothetical protein
MNKKLILTVTLATVVVLALSLGVAGLASAQTPNPPRPFAPGYGMGGGGMMGGGNGYGPGTMLANVDNVMHNAMFDALAKGLGISRTDLDARAAKGETPAQIASAKGINTTDFAKIWAEARQAGTDAAVAKGLITKEQAAWMLNRMNNRGGGYGLGNCPYCGTAPTK